ncbi:hypothetical protein KK062_27135 [Fulvivirgaceae bacterium PWU5]|uniref:Methylamine utilisation protein MauE domain-containing protein n=1 Tax=Dawidia cretensis TaxID=2782350 RepID=A0AAP2E4Z1_9BACT|nr:MauE/DoxX family redox-associated membrane protein [Dawidia cretensis]MBT1711947.1 hypothetical protein [Dawidia cretensis]
MKNSKIIDVIIFLFVMLFIYAAFSKLREYETFQGQIGKSPLIMDYASWIAFLVPLIEIAIAVSLLIVRLQLIALYAAFSLMFLFSAYIWFILTFSPYVPCSCGGILDKMGWTEHLVFNIIFTLLAVVGIHLNLSQQKDRVQIATT